jgi:hypothetical protein
LPTKKLSGAQYRKIRAIKSRGLSASYAARLIRGIKAGKTQQEARGHHRGEARERREREREELGGLSRAEEQSVRNWYNKRFNPHGSDKSPDEETVVEYAQQQGIERFRSYQHTWNEARRTYAAELKRGIYASRGLGYLEMLTEMARVRPEGDTTWLYYH